MRKTSRALGTLSMTASRAFGTLSMTVAAALILSATPAAADCAGMREFRGRILEFKKIGKKPGFVVQNQRDDKVAFRKAKSIRVVDRRAGAEHAIKWKDLHEDMDISVCWKFDDRPDHPPRAHKVTVRGKLN
ncbi:MAG: hypothetical protein GY723_02125 [bacterium]|nr:hypothetical protein [bacterium]